MLVRSSGMIRVRPDVPVSPCAQCSGRRRIIGFKPSNQCSECRISLYRCDSCGERSKVTVCAIMELS